MRKSLLSLFQRWTLKRKRYFYEGEGGFVDIMSIDEVNENDWPQVSSSFSLADDAQDLEAKYKAAMEAPELEDPISKKISQFYKDILKIQKLQNAGLQSSIKSLRNELEATRDKQEDINGCKTSPYDFSTDFGQAQK